MSVSGRLDVALGFSHVARPRRMLRRRIVAIAGEV